jgi:uncharacterized protein
LAAPAFLSAVLAQPPTPIRLAAVVITAALGGAVNSIAGGGTLLTFPALIALGIDPIVANATSTVALWPGALGSVWGYRGELGGARAWVVGLAVPSVIGGVTGALLLLATPSARFDAIVPWLIFGATMLFMAQGPLLAWLRRRDARATAIESEGAAVTEAARPSVPILIFQLVIAVYGGYFGAGLGILMLAALGFMGFTHIHRMNGLKNWGGLCTNAVAAATFALSGVVNWPVAVAMAVGAIAGGYGGSRLAQRVPQKRIRQAIIGIGVAATIWLLTGRL